MVFFKYGIVTTATANQFYDKCMKTEMILLYALAIYKQIKRS